MNKCENLDLKTGHGDCTHKRGDKMIKRDLDRDFDQFDVRAPLTSNNLNICQL
jgi:hypothetical protein